MYKQLAKLISIVVVVGLFCSVAAGNSFTDEGSTHLWTDPCNWSDGVPAMDGNSSEKWADMDVNDTTCIIDSTVTDANAGGVYPGCFGVDNEMQMSGGYLDVRYLNVGRGHANEGGSGYLKMTGGEIDAEQFEIPNQFESGSPGIVGHLDLWGGTINVSKSKFSMGINGSTGTMDIREGTLVVEGDAVEDIQDYIDNGWITAYGGEAGASLQLDYDDRVAGKTVLTALPANPKNATYPIPPDGSTSARPEPTLTWNTGVYTQQQDGHDLYIGENSDDVETADSTTHPGVTYVNLDANSYQPQAFDFGETVYWRVDQINDACSASPWKGDVWNFTVGTYAVVDDMELYGDQTVPPPQSGSRIWYTWRDGAGWATNWEPDGPDYYGNGSGAVAGLAELPGGTVHKGSQALQYDYSSTGSNVFGMSGLDYYSEMEASISDLEVGSNWAAYAKALDLWFYGDVDNDVSEQMWVALEDSTATSAVVEYPGDMNDIAGEQWIHWRIELRDFSGVDLSDVESISLGFGERGDTSTPGGEGTVYFDDIRLYPCRAGGITADFSGDCVVDYKDLVFLADNWLDAKYWQ